MFAANSDTVLKVLRQTGVSGFEILCSTLFVQYAVVRILAVIRAQSSRNLPWSLSERNCKTSLKLASMKTAASRRPGRRKHSSARFIIAVVVFFLAWHLVKNYPIVRIMFVSDRVSDNVALLVTILLVANSAANPLVYAFLKRDIKENSRGLSIGPWYQANC